MKIKLILPSPNFPNGFTLIEMLVVTTLTVIVIVAGTAIFLTTLLGGGRANTTTLVKTNGDYALGQMEFLLRNAVEFLPIVAGDPDSACEENMSSIRFRSIDQGVTTLLAESNKIASNSGVYLTSDQVELVGPLDFDCVRSADRAVTTVRMSFELRRGQAGVDRASEVLQQTFSTSVQVRSQ